MYLFKSPLFVLALGIFLGNQVLQKAYTAISLLHYLDNVTGTLMLLTAVLFIQRKITFRNEAYTFSKFHLVSGVLYITFIFEVVLPIYSSLYTYNFYDILAYAVGGLLFYKGINFYKEAATV